MLLNVSECSYHNEYFTLCFSPNHLWLLKLNYYLYFNCVIHEPRDAEELGLSCISLRKPPGLSQKSRYLPYSLPLNCFSHDQVWTL